MLPVIQVAPTLSEMLLWDSYVDEIRISSFDQVIACTKLNSSENCSTMSQMRRITHRFNILGGARSYPIFPAADNKNIVGMISLVFQWDELISKALLDPISGIDCVLRDDVSVFTFHISDGTAVLMGEGDLHDHQYDSYRSDHKLFDIGMQVCTSGTRLRLQYLMCDAARGYSYCC